MNTIKINKQNTLMVAHRGVSGLEKENSNLAFVAAGNHSYWGIETDIHCTADGNFILIHDDTTTRVTGIEATVEETDYATLRKMRLLDIDNSTLREDICMPTLEEYLGICKKYEKTAVLELKRAMQAEDVAKIVERIRKADYLEHVVFISFSFQNLVYVRELLPDQRVQFLFKKFTDEIIERVKAHRFDIDVEYKALTKEIIDELHAAGIKVNCWTVNRPEDGERLADWGVDFITTNILE